MAMNDVAFNVMYMRLGFSAPAETELVRTEGINSLRLLGGLNIDHVKSLVKAICRSCGAAINHAVSETAEHHLIVACHICKYSSLTSRESKTCADLVTSGDLFEEAEHKMELKRNWDSDQEIFHAFTNVEVNKNFNVLYKEFKDCCYYVRGCTKNPIFYLMRKNLIPKDKIDEPEADFLTLDQQIIQGNTIVKAANVNDVNLKNSGARASKYNANTDNAKSFDLNKTAYGETRLWVHAKLSQRNRNGHKIT